MAERRQWNRFLDLIFTYRAAHREMAAAAADLAELNRALTLREPHLKRILRGVIQQWHGDHYWCWPLPPHTHWSSSVSDCPVCREPGGIERTTITSLPATLAPVDGAGRALTSDEYVVILAHTAGNAAPPAPEA